MSRFNACRSPMAEGLTNSLGSTFLEARSAGVGARPLDEKAIKVMEEKGIDISNTPSRLLDKELLQWADLVIVMDPMAGVRVGSLPGHVQRRDYIFDPVKTSASLDDYRLLRDRILMRVQAIEGGMKMLAKSKEHRVVS